MGNLSDFFPDREGVTGSGTVNKIPIYTSLSAVGDSIINQPNARDIIIDNDSTSSKARLAVRTEYPQTAFHVEGAVKTTTLNASEQGFFAGNLPFIKQAAYGKGKFFAQESSENIPTMYAGYGPGGKMLEVRKSMLVRVPENGWPESNGQGQGLRTTIQLVPFEPGQVIMDVRVTAMFKPNLDTASEATASWGTDPFPVRLIMVGNGHGPQGTNNTNYCTLAGLPNDGLTYFMSNTDQYRFFQFPVGVQGAFTNAGANTTASMAQGNTSKGQSGLSFWQISGKPSTNPPETNAASLRLMLVGTTKINTNVKNDWFFYVEYVAMNHTNVLNHANKTAVSVFSALPNTNPTYARNLLLASNNKQHDIRHALVLPDNDTRYWHNGKLAFPKAGDRVFKTDGTTGYNSSTPASNGFYYLYSAGGVRHWMRIKSGYDPVSGETKKQGEITNLSSNSIPEPYGPTQLRVSFLVVAGGGLGGDGAASKAGGGGGGGGVNTSFGIYSGGDTIPASQGKLVPLTLDAATNYTVTVGEGGTQGSGTNNGEDSVFATIQSKGGGAGGSADNVGIAGGSNGGNGYNTSGASSIATLRGSHWGSATGFKEGFYGGDGNLNGGGGGGGAGLYGQSMSNNAHGGRGLQNSITGTEVRYGNGGGGGRNSGTTVALPGYDSGLTPTSSGGGTGGVLTGSVAAGNGTANTGSGGGGAAGTASPGNGGSGIVAIRYKEAKQGAGATGNWVITNPGGGLTYTTTHVGDGDILVKFTAGTGTIQFN